MRIDIHGQHIDVTPALRDYVAMRFERLGRHFERPFDVRTVLSVEKTRQWAEATVSLSGRVFHADAEGSDNRQQRARHQHGQRRRADSGRDIGHPAAGQARRAIRLQRGGE